MGSANSIEHPLLFTQAFSSDEQNVQHTFRAKLFPWSPTVKPKYWKYIHFINGVKTHFLEENVISPHI